MSYTKDQAVHCLLCQHYAVSWDKHFPHACKQLGFKSYQLPCLEVLASSGRQCLAFLPKAKPPIRS